MPSKDLVARVEALGASGLRALAYRHVSPGRDPRAGTGALIHGGRWNPPGGFAVIYLALDSETLAAEFHRAARRQGLRPEDFLPRRVYRFQLHLQAVLDLRPGDARSGIPLGEAELRSDDPSRCQAIGAAAHQLGREGVVAPAAAGPGVVVAVFLDHLRPESRMDAVASETWESAPPLTGAG